MKRRGVPPSKRRRVRGGGATSSRNAAGVIEIPDDDPVDIAQQMDFDGISMDKGAPDLDPDEIAEIEESEMTFEQADDYFELYDNENLVLILPYDGDMDDRVLEEIRPRFVIMYEPNPSFIRRVEVGSASVTF
jgi:DNA excision repair protein ERCC-4